MQKKGEKMNKQKILFAVLIAGLTLLVVLGCASGPGAAGAGPVANANLAKGMTATASSIESDKLSPANAIDGKPKTRWSTDWKNDANPDDGWFAVDLGKKQKISRVVLNWEAAFGLVYNIEVSDDGAAYTTVLEVKNGKKDKNEYTLPEGTAGQYLRVKFIKRGTEWGYSLYECEIY
jgi:hypothetical protein